MAQFSYNSITADGRHISGVVSAASREAAIEMLRHQGQKPLTVREEKTSLKKLTLKKKKVKLKDLVIFTRELSTMVSAGVPLPRSLETLADQTENKYFKTVITGINHDVTSGLPLASSMSKYPNVFSDVYVNMVGAGEAGGILDEILKRLATQVEKDASIRKKIRSAMAYPVVILSVTVVAFFGIMLFVLPRIGKILTDLGGPDAKLPIYTQVMLGISNFLVGSSVMKAVPLINSVPLIKSLPNAVLIIGLMIVGLIYFRRYIKTPKGSYKYYRVLLRSPVLGNVLTKVAVARFSRTFSSLMGAGVSVLESLEVTGRASGNPVIQQELERIAEAVKNGQPLGKQLMTSQYFPPIVGQMIIVGEETGKIDEILIKVADFYEEEVDAVIDGLASIIEPMMIIILGAIVGLIAASVMGPIASLSKNIGG